MPRRVNDFYPTPSWATEVLLKRIPLLDGHTVIEPCAGKHDITKRLSSKFIFTCDIDPKMEVNLVTDMSTAEGWEQAMTQTRQRWGREYVDWTITNPPFNCAIDFAKHGFANSKIGMALLLRLTFLEPVNKREQWLKSHPPDQLIVLPRISFTGDGKHDSVTCAWMVWHKLGKNISQHGGIEIVGKGQQ